MWARANHSLRFSVSRMRRSLYRRSLAQLRETQTLTTINFNSLLHCYCGISHSIAIAPPPPPAPNFFCLPYSSFPTTVPQKKILFVLFLLLHHHHHHHISIVFPPLPPPLFYCFYPSPPPPPSPNFYCFHSSYYFPTRYIIWVRPFRPDFGLFGQGLVCMTSYINSSRKKIEREVKTKDMWRGWCWWWSWTMKNNRNVVVMVVVEVEKEKQQECGGGGKGRKQ